LHPFKRTQEGNTVPRSSSPPREEALKKTSNEGFLRGPWFFFMCVLYSSIRAVRTEASSETERFGIACLQGIHAPGALIRLAENWRKASPRARSARRTKRQGAQKPSLGETVKPLEMTLPCFLSRRRFFSIVREFSRDLFLSLEGF